MRQVVQRIFMMTPHGKQTMMFSATLSADVRPVCKRFMHQPLEIFINDDRKLTLDGLLQFYVQLQEVRASRNRTNQYIISHMGGSHMHVLLFDEGTCVCDTRHLSRTRTPCSS